MPETQTERPPLAPWSHELTRYAEPVDYNTILGSSRVLLLSFGIMGDNPILSEHLKAQSEVFRLAGITHYIPGTPRLVRERGSVEERMRSSGININLLNTNPQELLGDPQTKLAILLDAYLALKIDIPAYLNSQSLGLSLPRLGYPTTSVLYKDFGPRTEKFAGFGFADEAFMLNLNNLAKSKEAPQYLKGFDFLIHLPNLNANAQ